MEKNTIFSGSNVWFCLYNTNISIANKNRTEQNSSYVML